MREPLFRKFFVAGISQDIHERLLTVSQDQTTIRPAFDGLANDLHRTAAVVAAINYVSEEEYARWLQVAQKIDEFM